MKTTVLNKKSGIAFCLMLIAITIIGGAEIYAQGSSQNRIGEEKAKSIALEHAGVNESDVAHIISRLDYDDRKEEYDVEFWVGNMEYDYEINAQTGEIVSFDHNAEYNYAPSTSTSTDYIGEERAKAIALNDAGVSEDKTRSMKSKFDFDDGRAEYEVEWRVGRTEYDYTIDAVRGAIIGKDIDKDDWF